MLAATRAGDLAEVKKLTGDNAALVRCEHNYMPPLQLAVREGHTELVEHLLQQGAYDRADAEEKNERKDGPAGAGSHGLGNLQTLPARSLTVFPRPIQIQREIRAHRKAQMEQS